MSRGLLRNQDYDIYVRDGRRRCGSPAAITSCRASGGRRASGLVNTSKVNIEIFRVGDRNLLPTIRSQDFLSQLYGFRLRQYGEQDGAKIWSGVLEVKSELNQDVITDFPVLEALGEPKPASM